MDTFIEKKRAKIVDLLRQRELQEAGARQAARNLHVTDRLVARLGLEKELKGHEGCVNCLEWNKSGEILASASDDRHVILWDPFRYVKKAVMGTQHHGNIFSVKFVPESNDTLLVTGAADCYVCVRDLDMDKAVLYCSCHKGRVKRIATAQGVPFMFWSAGEDGLILQYDTRVRHTCVPSSGPNVLINLTAHLGKYAEAKCVDVNARRPELIAVGANDAYVRIYDRRMIRLSPLRVLAEDPPGQPGGDRANSRLSRAAEDDANDNVPLASARYYIAGHLRPGRRAVKGWSRSMAATYLTFSADGNELLVNMGGEQIYLFDINDHGKQSKFTLPNAYRTRRAETPEGAGDSCSQRQSEYSSDNAIAGDVDDPEARAFLKSGCLPPDVESIKLEANEAFQQRKYMIALSLYNKALGIYPYGAVLYANRAAVLMKRAWDGDVYAALRDCIKAIELDPSHVKAHFRVARCLYDLSRPTEAREAICNFQQKFPEYARNAACRALCSDIKAMLALGQDMMPNKPIIHGVSSYERQWRENCADYRLRFSGHCNTTTDIKEANFFGSMGQYIVAGSDDGSFFIWDRKTTNILRVLNGDDSIVNCLQPHPSTCLLATSGIDPVIRLWSPLPEDGSKNERDIHNLEEVVVANQARMDSDPFELMLRSMGYRFEVEPNSSTDDDARADGDDGTADNQDVSRYLNCQQS